MVTIKSMANKINKKIIKSEIREMHILFYFARISLKVIEFWLSENFDKGFTSTFHISCFCFFLSLI